MSAASSAQAIVVAGPKFFAKSPSRRRSPTRDLALVRRPRPPPPSSLLRASLLISLNAPRNPPLTASLQTRDCVHPLKHALPIADRPFARRPHHAVSQRAHLRGSCRRQLCDARPHPVLQRSASKIAGVAAGEHRRAHGLPAAGRGGEPTASELASLVEFSAVGDGATRDVIFQATATRLKRRTWLWIRCGASAKRDKIAFRLNTLGLVDAGTGPLLVGRGEFESHLHAHRRGERLPARRDSQQYAELLQPIEGRGCRRVLCPPRRGGVNVEVTAVDRPDVDVREVEALALRLGAQSFRTRSWVG